MRVLTRASMVLVLSSAAIFAPAVASAHSRPRHPCRDRGDVYVNDNTATSNTVAAFHRRPYGSLQPLPGSPFATGGAGTGAGIGSQGSLQTAFDGRYVLAVDAGPGQISVLAVGRDGSLHPVPGGTVSSGGAQPVSIAVHDDLVYVANAGVGRSTLA